MSRGILKSLNITMGAHNLEDNADGYILVTSRNVLNIQALTIKSYLHATLKPYNWSTFNSA